MTLRVLDSIVVFMTKSGLSNSIRKFLRREKARIRQDSLDSADAEKKIKDIVTKFITQHKDRKKDERKDR